MASNLVSGVPVLPARTAATNQADSAASAEASKKRAQLKKATQQFEAVFIGAMLKEVHKAMANSQPLFGNSYEAKFYQEMTDEQIADRMSQTGAFGLGKSLYKSLEKTLPPDPTANATGEIAGAQSAAVSTPGKAAGASGEAAPAAIGTAVAPEVRKK